MVGQGKLPQPHARTATANAVKAQTHGRRTIALRPANDSNVATCALDSTTELTSGSTEARAARGCGWSCCGCGCRCGWRWLYGSMDASTTTAPRALHARPRNARQPTRPLAPLLLGRTAAAALLKLRALIDRIIIVLLAGDILGAWLCFALGRRAFFCVAPNELVVRRGLNGGSTRCERLASTSISYRDGAQPFCGVYAIRGAAVRVCVQERAFFVWRASKAL